MIFGQNVKGSPLFFVLLHSYEHIFENLPSSLYVEPYTHPQTPLIPPPRVHLCNLMDWNFNTWLIQLQLTSNFRIIFF